MWKDCFTETALRHLFGVNIDFIYRFILSLLKTSEEAGKSGELWIAAKTVITLLLAVTSIALFRNCNTLLLFAV